MMRRIKFLLGVAVVACIASTAQAQSISYAYTASEVSSTGTTQTWNIYLQETHHHHSRGGGPRAEQHGVVRPGGVRRRHRRLSPAHQVSEPPA